jgi:regulator of RNase E activity RraA
MSIEVNTQFKRAPKAVLEGWRKLLREYRGVTPEASDVMNRLNAMTSDIRPLYEGIRIVGSALTVKTIEADLAPVIKVLELVRPDDVIVIDTHGTKDSAFWGEVVCTEAKLKGVVGVITDSAVRDVVQMRALKFPVLCAGFASKAATPVGFGYLGFPISCGGVVVNSGDVVVVDDNGVVVVPQAEAADVLQKTRRFLENELKVIARVKAGEHTGDVIGLQKLGTLDAAEIYAKERRKK